MHDTAMINARHFFDTYGKSFQTGSPVRIVEIGSQDVNGSLRGMAPKAYEYVGVDFVEGKGVDIVLSDPYALPFETGSVDMIVTSSCFEHSEMFWVVFLEIIRVLKPKGLLYINVPSNGAFHRYPVDCWRFYPDSGAVLVTWAKRNGLNVALLESYVSEQVTDQWNDYVGVFLREAAHASDFPSRIVDIKTDFTNGTVYGKDGFLNFNDKPQDLRRGNGLISKLVWRIRRTIAKSTKATS